MFVFKSFYAPISLMDDIACSIPLEALLRTEVANREEIDVTGLNEDDARMLRSAHSLLDDCDASSYGEIAEFVIDEMEKRGGK